MSNPGQALQNLDSGILPLSWEDFIIMPSTTKLGSASDDPTFVAWDSRFVALSFSGSALNECFFDVQVPHGRKPGSDLKFHVHFTPYGTMVLGQTVIWRLDYAYANIGGEFSATATVTSTYTALGTETALTHCMSEQTTVPGTSIGESAIIKCRVYRTAADTYDAAAFMHSVDLHVYKDRVGGKIFG